MSTNVPIASITLSAATRSVTFSGIPQTYTDLVMVMTGTNATGGAGSVRFQFNGDNTSVYSSTRLLGNGTSASSTGNLNESSANVGYYSDSIIGNNIVSIMNYSNSTTYKTCLHRSNATDSRAQTGVALWRNTSAITSITVLNGSGNYDFTAGCTFNLYGINSANSAQAKATGGDSIYRDSSYWYHVFNNSGTFTPAQSLSNVDYLVVAGGGGGGNDSAGGGGGGGLRSTVTATGGGGSLESTLSLTAQAYTVTVGAGGTGGAASGNPGAQGSNSVFSTITSTGGGGGGGRNNANATTGGSGGGGSGINSNSGAAGTANQGFAGGNANQGGGGGGGAGAAGSNTSSGAGGSGGNGVATSISGSSVTYAGGGGGGRGDASAGRASGGSGGGGQGGATNTGAVGENGTTNLGGGGGGGGREFAPGTGGNGGSGIVIVRYPV